MAAPPRPARPPKPSKFGAEKLTPAEQRRRFIEAAQESGASEIEADFDRGLGAIVKPKSG